MFLSQELKIFLKRRTRLKRWKWTQRMGGVDLVMILDPQHRRLIRHAHQGSRWRQRQEEKDNLWGKMGIWFGACELERPVVIKRQQQDPAERNW